MRTQVKASALAISLAALPGVALADGPYKQYTPEVEHVAPVSQFQWETAIRYWNSTGKMAKDLYDPFVTTQQNSRLTYNDSQAHSGELVARLDHKPTGLFLKGFIGGGSIVNGKMNDEDFPGGYTNTLQEIHSGNLKYFTADFGWTFYNSLANASRVSIKDDDGYRGLRGVPARLGMFIGYNYWNEFAQTFGCNQIATPGSVCSPAPVTTGQYTLGQDNTWKSLRLGLTGDVALGERWTLSGDAAYTRTELDGFDHHQLRPDINPLHETGKGNGVQLEALLKYNVTDMFGIGVGARYWKNYTNGSTQFPGGVPPSPERWQADRSGVFVQGSMKFN